MHGNEARFRWNPPLPSPHTFTICPSRSFFLTFFPLLSLCHTRTHTHTHTHTPLSPQWINEIDKNKWRGGKERILRSDIFLQPKDWQKKKKKKTHLLTQSYYIQSGGCFDLDFFQILRYHQYNRGKYNLKNLKLETARYSVFLFLFCPWWLWKLTLRDNSVKKCLAPWSQSIAQANIQRLTALS